MTDRHTAEQRAPSWYSLSAHEIYAGSGLSWPRTAKVLVGYVDSLVAEVERVTRERDEWRDRARGAEHNEGMTLAEAAGLRERNQQLRDALAVYADPRNWAISRDDLNCRVVSWIGPGAEKRGLPDAPETARAALGDGEQQ